MSARTECAVRLHVLGPLRAQIGGRPVDLGPARRRAVLEAAILAQSESLNLWRGGHIRRRPKCRRLAVRGRTRRGDLLRSCAR